DEEKNTFAPLVAKFKELLKDQVEDVRLTSRLKDSPSCIVYDKNKPDFAMQQLLKQMGQEQNFKPILEINPGIPTVVFGFFAAIVVAPFIVWF
ncbi:hypothetical protein WQ50_00210, partial [Acinetobacter baumannii]